MQLPNRKPGKYTFASFDPYLTQEKFDEFIAELEKLKKIVMPKAAADVKRYGENGDFSENAEYQIAKGRLRGINQKILNLQEQLKDVKIISKPSQNNTVQIGHTVKLNNLANNKEIAFRILGPAETDPGKNIISYKSPLGAGLLGKRVGEIAKIRLGDREVEYKVLAIN